MARACCLHLGVKEEAAPAQPACISQIMVSQPGSQRNKLYVPCAEELRRAFRGRDTSNYELTGLGGIGSEQGALQVWGKVGVMGGPGM